MYLLIKTSLVKKVRQTFAHGDFAKSLVEVNLSILWQNMCHLKFLAYKLYLLKCVRSYWMTD